MHNARDSTFDASQLQAVEDCFQELDVSLARAAWFVRKTGKQVRKAVQRDRQDHLQQSLRNPKELFRSLRQVFPQARSSTRTGFRPLPQLRLSDGSCAVSKEDRLCRWGEYFSEMEAGFPVDDSEYMAALDEQRQLDHAARQGKVRLDWKAVVALPELELLIHSQRHGKATGHDGISAELLRLHVPAAARQLYPLFAKTSLSLREPVWYKGGCLLALAKKAAAASLCTDYRSILVACAPAKFHHKVLRNRLAPILQGVRQELQSGSVPGTGIEALSLVVRAFQDHAAASKICWGVIFHDIRSAFYGLYDNWLRRFRNLTPSCAD